MRLFGLCLLIILCVSNIQAATLTGGVYDNALNSVSNVVIYVNTTPQQKHVSKFGGFSFTLNPGQYHITVNYTTEYYTQRIAEDFITITDQDGQYRRDIFLFDSISLSQNNSNRSNNTTSSINSEQVSEFTSWWILLLAAGTIIFMMTLLFILIALKKPKRDTQQGIAGRELVIELLRENKGSVSQKSLRKQLPMSESKVSMLLTDLEKEGIIEKQKSGRINIIKLK